MLTLHSWLQDHAVVQAGRPIRVSGRSRPGATVEVRLAGAARRATADAAGAWACEFPARPAGESFDLDAACDGARVACRDLIAGEVWICSGQSNMEWTLAMIKGAEAEIARADDPWVRCFTAPRTTAAAPAGEVGGRWDAVRPDNAGAVSALAWHFASALRAALDVPVGVVVAAWGGSSILWWLPPETLGRRPEYELYARAASGECVSDGDAPHPYAPRAAVSAGWESPEFDDRDWVTLLVPGHWQEQRWWISGAVWYRARIPLPERWRGRALTLDLGPVDDFDDTYANGVRIGGLGEETTEACYTPRRYRVPSALTRADSLTLAVRVFDRGWVGGILGAGRLLIEDDPAEWQALPMTWRARPEAPLPLRTPQGMTTPGHMYNGMIHPFVGQPVRGFLWYQGESDVIRAQRYRMLLPDMIAGWRRAWGEPAAPFGVVQLASFMATKPEPVESDWAELRDAQRLTARTVPGVGLVSALDLGEADDIHPRHKRPVGERLAAWALSDVYRTGGPPWGHPDLADALPLDDRIRLRFSRVEGALRTRDGGPARGLQIAGADRRWVWAEAAITGPDTIEARHPRGLRPLAVRYAWQSNPDANLTDARDLPVLPFRTDNWPLTTAV